MEKKPASGRELGDESGDLQPRKPLSPLGPALKVLHPRTYPLSPPWHCFLRICTHTFLILLTYPWPTPPHHTPNLEKADICGPNSRFTFPTAHLTPPLYLNRYLKLSNGSFYLILPQSPPPRNILNGTILHPVRRVRKPESMYPSSYPHLPSISKSYRFYLPLINFPQFPEPPTWSKPPLSVSWSDIWPPCFQSSPYNPLFRKQPE